MLWIRYTEGQRCRLRDLDAILEAALNGFVTAPDDSGRLRRYAVPVDLPLAIRCIAAMARIDTQTIQMGLLLGIYRPMRRRFWSYE